MLDTLLARNDTPGAALRTLYDPYNDEQLTLSRAELRMLLNMQQGKTPHLDIDPYTDHVDWYSNTVDAAAAPSATAPKRRFRPSEWEEQKVVKLARAPLTVAHLLFVFSCDRSECGCRSMSMWVGWLAQ